VRGSEAEMGFFLLAGFCLEKPFQLCIHFSSSEDDESFIVWVREALNKHITLSSNQTMSEREFPLRKVRRR
jgi:hypothetical protein